MKTIKIMTKVPFQKNHKIIPPNTIIEVPEKDVALILEQKVGTLVNEMPKQFKEKKEQPKLEISFETSEEPNVGDVFKDRDVSFPRMVKPGKKTSNVR